MRRIARLFRLMNLLICSSCPFNGSDVAFTWSPLHAAVGRFNNVVFIGQFRKKTIFVFVRLVKKNHRSEWLHSYRILTHVIGKIRNTVCLNKNISRGKRLFDKSTVSSEKLTVSAIRNNAAVKKPIVNVIIDHFPGLFFISCICPEHVPHMFLPIQCNGS